MIHGIGVDLVKIKRIKKIYVRYKDKFTARILSQAELQELKKTNDRVNFLAKRFAAKEALAKALGSGVRGFWLTDITIIHDADGKPGLKFNGACLKKINQKQIANSHLSLSDENKYVLAFVVLET